MYLFSYLFDFVERSLRPDTFGFLVNLASPRIIRFSFPFSSDCFQSTYILSCLSALLPVCFIMDLYNNNNNRERNTKIKENSKKQRTDWSIDWLTTVNSSISTYPAVSCVCACFYSISVGASELLARLSPCLVYAAECHRSVVLLWLLSRFGIFFVTPQTSSSPRL